MSDFKAFSPTGSLIVVRPEKKDERFSKSRGGVILPENAEFKLAAGTVLAVGPGEFQNGFRVDADVEVGNRVLVEKTRVVGFKINDEEVWFCRPSSVFGILDASAAIGL